MQRDIHIKSIWLDRTNTKEVMERRGISRNVLARAVNTRFEVIDKWYQGHIEKIDADILARICFVLECAPEDIIRYVFEE